MTSRPALLLCALLAACASAPATAPVPVDGSPEAAAPPDAPPSQDAALPMDAAVDAPAPADAPVPPDATWDGSMEILGTLRGTCGTIRAMLSSPSPSLLRNELTFVASERYERAALSPGGQRMYDTANAGGSSTESEVLSTEVLHYCEGAALLRTETEVRYRPADDAGANSITDLVVEIGGVRVGVSVTRVYRPLPMTLSDADVRTIVEGKLVGVNRSSVRVLPKDRWVKQVLHVFVRSDAIAEQVERVWAALPAATRADTIVLVTVTRGGGFLYCNPDPPLGAECPPIGG